MSNKNKGRPQGSPNIRESQIVHTPACPYCKVTDRTKYRLVAVLAYAGVTAAGVPYSHIVTRRTKCKGCHRRRCDKFFENRIPEANPGDENEPATD